MADSMAGMTGWWWADVLLGAAAALVVTWVVLLAVLLIARPRGDRLQEALRLLPDVLRLLRRLATDRGLDRGVRWRLGLLLVYLASPIDLVPDVVPLLGYADDAIVATLVLRSVARRAGVEAIRAHWPGTEDGFTALCRLAGLHTQRQTGHDRPE